MKKCYYCREPLCDDCGDCHNMQCLNYMEQFTYCEPADTDEDYDEFFVEVR